MNRLSLGLICGVVCVLVAVRCTVVLADGSASCPSLNKTCQQCVKNPACRWYDCGSTGMMCMNRTYTKVNCSAVAVCVAVNVTATSRSNSATFARTTPKLSVTPTASKSSSVKASSGSPGGPATKSSSKIKPTPAAPKTTTSLHPIIHPSASQPAPHASSIIPQPSVPPATLGPGPVKPKEEGRRFDGASFIGGMILSAGLILLGYFGWQWYRSRSRSYHSL